jgi:hypothetical protein
MVLGSPYAFAQRRLGGCAMVYRKSHQGDMWHCCRNCRSFAHTSSSAVLRLVIGAVGAGFEPLPIDYNDLAPRQPNDSPAFEIV